jgi:hypothetical protein
MLNLGARELDLGFREGLDGVAEGVGLGLGERGFGGLAVAPEA